MIFAGGAAIGGLLATVASLPGSWYGVPETDSYVFTPAPPNPLWFARDVVPILTILAGLGLLLGVGGLLFRDYHVADRWRRFGGIGTAIGMVGMTIAGSVFAVSNPSEMGGAVAIVAAFGVLLLSGLLLVPSLIAFGIGYLKADRTPLGAILIGLPVLLGASWFVDLEAGSVTLGVTIALAGIAIAHDLWTHPDPVEPPTNGQANSDGLDRDRESGQEE